ncbi:MAG: CPBP family intramembrane glutamic endopeptidase [Polyangiales bacterium]
MPRARESLRAHLSAIDAEAAAERAAASGPDRGPVVACVIGTFALVFMEYVDERVLIDWLATHLPSLYLPRFHALLELAAWVFVRLIGFVLFPVIAIRALLGTRVRDHGLAPARLGDLGAYLLLFAAVLPAVLLAARRPEFAAYYPFYKLAHASWLDLVAWELLYAAHFAGLEFFFRGFWLTACRRTFGSHALLVSAVPYCMIHFTKPVIEVIAALPAGLVLGLLAMRARSIWGGVLLHVAVAWLMDALALMQGAGLPRRVVPW